MFNRFMVLMINVRRDVLKTKGGLAGSTSSYTKWKSEADRPAE
jgi:hypothetical protein